MKELRLRAEDGLELSIAVAEIEESRGVVQLIHGMAEHKERYYDFMRFLNANGLTAVISDNRGHGASVNEDYPLGHMEGCGRMMEDQMVVTHYIKSQYPELPLYLFGHSFGSLLARYYLQEHDHEIQKLALSGTVNYIPAVPVGRCLGHVMIGLQGKKCVSRLLNRMGMNGGDDTWVSASEENLKNYRKDPLCQLSYSNGGIMTIFEAVQSLHRPERYQCRNRDLPILSVTGDGDPVTGGAKGLADTIRSLERAGYHEIASIVYPGMKHEVLNEEEHLRVYKDILHFLLGKDAVQLDKKE